MMTTIRVCRHVKTGDFESLEFEVSITMDAVLSPDEMADVVSDYDNSIMKAASKALAKNKPGLVVRRRV
jgi:hypothetical protein